MNSRRSLPEVRTMVSARLRERRVEVTRAVIQRALSLAPPTGREEVGYLQELRDAIGQVVDYAIDAIELGQDRLGATPPAVYLQAMSAVRNEVGLDVVLRRYASGYGTLTDFLFDEARNSNGDSHYPDLQRELTALFDRLVNTVSETYKRAESELVPSSSKSQRIEKVRGLLSGDLLEPEGLGYELAYWHLGLAIRHLGEADVLRRLAAELDRQVLIVEVDEVSAWAWLGGRRPFSQSEEERIQSRPWPQETTVGSGAPADGPQGWRLTHRQAVKALAIGARLSRQFAPYAETALQSAILRDDDLVEFLETRVLAPLSQARDGGENLRDTLRVYFASGHSVSSTASTLGVSRKTVTSRLQGVEERLERPIRASRAEIEAALAIETLRD
jgi:hypothetical protein